MAVSRTNSEEGFVLVAAIWLLILIGSIAALILARSLAAARETAGDAEALRTKLTLEAAIETVTADLLINGQRSPYAMVPYEGVVDLGGRRVSVRIGSEAGKLDLNGGDLALIERVLSGLGWDGAERMQFVQQLRARREAREPLRSLNEAARIAGLIHQGDTPQCLSAYFTVHNGRAGPDPASAGPALNRLLGRPAMELVAPRPMASGSAVWIEARTQGGNSTRVVLRLGGLINQPATISSWGVDRGCEDSR